RQLVSQAVGKPQHDFFDHRRTAAQQEIDGGSHAENARVVRRGLLEAARARLEGEVVVDVLSLVDHALGSDDHRVQTVEHARSDVSEAGTHGTEEPFLRAYS